MYEPLVKKKDIKVGYGSKTKAICIYMPKESFDLISKISKKDGKSISEFGCEIIESYLKTQTEK